MWEQKYSTRKNYFQLKKKTDLESPYSPATQVSGRTAGAEAEHIKCRAHPLLHRAKKQKNKKNIHTFRIAFTARPGHWGGQRIRDHGDESGRLACVDTQKLNSGSDKESIVSKSGKGAPLAFIRHKRLIVDIFGCGSARPWRSLYIKMHSTPYLYCIWTFPSSD